MFLTGSSILSGFSIKHHTHTQQHFVKSSGFSIMSLYIILKDNSKKIRLLGWNKLAHTNAHARTSHSLCCVQPTGHKHNLMICGRHCLCLFVCLRTSGAGCHVCHLLESIQEGSGHRDGRPETRQTQGHVSAPRNNSRTLTRFPLLRPTARDSACIKTRGAQTVRAKC